MIPLYKWILFTPHADKEKMEDLAVVSMARWTIIRPSLLIDRNPLGLDAVRVGVETPISGQARMVEKKEIGYRIARVDVAAWIFANCVQNDGERWGKKIVSLTY